MASIPDPSVESQDAAQAATSADSDSAFAILDEGIQRQLWRMKWTELWPIQVEAIHTILGSDADVVIAADTASGKTEAAFLPILSSIAAEPAGSVRAMYVGPLKALINDQFARLEELCHYVEIPVHRWHGDIAANRKSKLIEAPGGVLLITPESLESLFINRTSAIPRLFGGLSFVVIDELHAFLSASRGLHLQSLLRRLPLRARAGTGPRTVGLSATIGDLKAARQFLNPDRPDSVRVIEDTHGRTDVLYRVHAYLDAGSVSAHTEPEPIDNEDQENKQEDDESATDTDRRMARDIFDHCHGATNLVFANARRDVEVFGDLCREIAEGEGFRDAILVHHGSLSREIRFDAEAIMKSGRPVTTFCSSTLELGIDIGDIRACGQIGPPWSVASLKQRLGRSGRKPEQPRIMRVYLRLKPKNHPDPLKRLQLPLVRTIAVTELMREHWSEPDHLPSCDLSTLTQQIISVIAETGGIRADRLHERLCGTGAFRDVEASLFAALLRQLGDEDVIEQMDGGDLILGLKGERIRVQQDFYAVFDTPLEYRVLADGRPIGTLPLIGIPNERDHLILAGRRWEVVSIDHERCELRVRRSKGKKAPLFGGGIGEIHPRIAEKMRRVLSADDEPAYLDNAARAALSEARAQYARMISGGRRRFMPLGDHKTIWFTWTGTRAQLTLRAALAASGIDAEDEEVAFVMPLDVDAAQAAVHSLVATLADRDRVASAVLPKASRKYDHLLSDELLTVGILRDRLDFDTARRIASERW